MDVLAVDIGSVVVALCVLLLALCKPVSLVTYVCQLGRARVGHDEHPDVALAQARARTSLSTPVSSCSD